MLVLETKILVVEDEAAIADMIEIILPLLCHNKQTKISSTNQGHGLCYYFFIVEVKKSRLASGTN